MTIEVRPVEVPVKEKSVADVLRHAALVIEKRGWCKVDREDAEGRVCITGAVEVAFAGRIVGDDDDPLWTTHYAEWGPFDHPAVEYFAAFVGAREAYEWNDSYGRTAADVTAALRAAADAWVLSQ